ncbi:hypothetical protein BKA62DRAFT_700166 [Auriculariales sp. MPI-PUGE-AT-0066]|nr:hypothetical protein BKA62DRAFT_700166 [Auriculariales sp. MPI-PUGE-AT-0066]
MFSWLTGSRDEPAPPDVDVLVCHSLDVSTEGITMTYGLFIPARLDAEKLKLAAFTTVEKKLSRAGARLAYRNGKYEYHVPKSFTKDTPALSFTSDQYDSPFQSEKYNFPPKVGNDLASSPFVSPFPEDAVKALFKTATTPQTTADFLVPNTPMVHIHVSVFEDVTLIGFTAPHMLFDGAGASTFLSTWTAALNGTLEELPEAPRTFAPFDDLVESVGGREVCAARRGPSGQPVRGWDAFYTIGILRFMFALFKRAFFEGSEDTRLIYVPLEWLAARKDECMQELKARGSDEWVGSNDVLMAYICKMMCVNRTDATLVSMIVPVNIRPILTDFFTHTYLHNALMSPKVPSLSANVLGSQPIVDTALVLRRGLNEILADKTTLKHELAWVCASFPGARPVMIPNPPNVELASISNWRSMAMNKLDFSGALPDGVSVLARPEFLFSYRTENPMLPLRGAGAVCSESDHGLWLYVTLGRGVWDRMWRSGMIAFA